MRVGGWEMGNQLLQAQHAAHLGVPRPIGVGASLEPLPPAVFKGRPSCDGALGRQALSLLRLG